MTIAIPAPRKFSKTTRGVLYCVSSGVLFGLMGVFSVSLFKQHFAIPNLLFWRFSIAALWMAIARFLSKPQTEVRYTRDRLTYIRVVLLTTFFYSFNSLFYFMAAHTIGTGVAMVIFFSFPAIVTFYAWVTGKWVFNVYGVAAICAVFIGMLMLKGHGAHALNHTGVLYSLIAAVFYAGYIIMSRNQMHVVDSATLTFATCLGNATFFLTLALMEHIFTLPATPTMWLTLILFSVISTALPIQLLLKGLRCISATRAAILSVTEPLVMVSIGVLVLHEKVSLMQGLGILTMLAGAILIQFEKPSDIDDSEPVLV